MRRLLTFPCAGAVLAATLDDAPGTTGLLIVSGGNELRIGAHRGMAIAAAAVAHAGCPVFRFDRRGIGDSTGINGGYASSGADIAAAAAAFRSAAGVERIVGFGNCDAATALALFHRDAGIDALLLANPWVVEPVGDLPPAAAIRARYAAGLMAPATWRRLLRGGIDLRRVARGLAAIVTDRRDRSPLMARMADALDGGAPPRILLARDDGTARAFADQWRHEPIARRIAVVTCPTASHSFAREDDATWLHDQMVRALRDDGAGQHR